MRARLLPVTAIAASLACGAREAPRPQVRAQPAPAIAQEPAEQLDESLAYPALEVQLRTGRTRVGEAVRLHVSGWRLADEPGLIPGIEAVGASATVERMGSEIVEEHEGRVRERVDFRVDPSEPGIVELAVGRSLVTKDVHPVTLVVAEALPERELAKLLSTHAGRLERGRSLARQGDYRRAIEAFQLALAERRDDPAVLSEIGWAAFLAGDHSLARRATREGLRYETDARSRGALLYNLGRIAEALERDDEAIAAYRRSLEVRPGSAPVRKRLEALEGRRTGVATEAAVDVVRACELMEEEGCPLFHQRGACRCEIEAIAELEAIGRWRLLTLIENGGGAGVNYVYFLLADAGDDARYHVFGPLPGSHFHGDLRGGVRSAELLGSGVLRVDFEGTVGVSALDGAGERLARAWTLVCGIAADGRPGCAAPLLSAYGRAGQPGFVGGIRVTKDGVVTQAVEAGVAPGAGELEMEFPGAGMRVLDGAARLEELLHPRPVR